MIRQRERDVAALLQDSDELAGIVSEAQRAAIRRHRLLGHPIAIWRDGRVVIEVPGDYATDTDPGTAIDDRTPHPTDRPEALELPQRSP